MKNSIGLEELSNGFCLAMANAFRLIEDGERLLEKKRYIGASGSLRSACDEIVKGYLIRRAVLLDENDSKGWGIFWSDFRDRDARRRVLTEDIHTEIYRNKESKIKYDQALDLLKEDFRGIWFEDNSERFLSPGTDAFPKMQPENMAKILYDYAFGLFHAFNFYGLPNTRSQFESFRAMRFAEAPQVK